MSQTKSVVTVVGARPQFVKAAAVSRAIASHNRANPSQQVIERIVHTGQHYDENMSRVFFDELEIPRPAMNLQVGSGSHGRQTGAMLTRIEELLVEDRPDWVLVYGDTNSTLAGALAAIKLHIPIAHVEAGLRSYNRRMPEEINRVMTDVVSSLLLCPTETAVANLTKEGITGNVHWVGDVMYDSVLFYDAMTRDRRDVLDRLSLADGGYYLATIHRAENTDDPARLEAILAALSELEHPVVLPLHPRTRHTLGARLAALGERICVTDPVSYLDMIVLERHARMLLTDSGGVQKEAYWFGKPCVTLRDETEWVELVSAGWNRIVGARTEDIRRAIADFEQSPPDSAGAAGLYGDGTASEKIVGFLASAPA